MDYNNNLSRREFLKSLMVLCASVGLAPYLPYKRLLEASEDKPVSKNFLTKIIPSSGEKIPVIGMGTWQTFDVGTNQQLLDQRTEVLKKFFELGGGMIDSSPMYGSSEQVLGVTLDKVNYPDSLFSASKIWTRTKAAGLKQFEDSQNLWGLKTFDLFQVHNLMDWVAHLQSLNELKDQGLIRYVGVTTSHGRRHDELYKLMLTQKLDFVQLTYNITHRDVEDRLLPLAQDKGIAVIANRPLDGGWLMRQYENKPLPDWAVEADISNWAQFFLKFIVSHPAMTCAIPATTQVEHMAENMGACYGRLPDEPTRKRMISYVESLS